jgi:tetratricopeptide (TPR) repeat protein
VDQVDRLIVDLDPAGQARIAAWRAGDLLPDPPAEQNLTWPLDDDALDDLRWYLEDYLETPFGVYEDRGTQVQRQLADWGEATFRTLFAPGPARDAYVRMRARGNKLTLVFRSRSPALLGLPWELMRDPGRPTALALDLDGVSRTLPTADLADTIEVPGGRLRVLMVISRPSGRSDVGYQMIARPLLRRLDAVRGEVDLVVLRPPTLDALRETLDQARRDGQPFQLVHFDGHGVLRGRRADGLRGSDKYVGPGPEGVLVFEKPGGGADEAPASTVAQILKDAQVPVVVLNACQSGAIGSDLSAAIATRLLQEGTAAVVAMAYTVYAVAAAEFMAAFYERLFAGDPVSAAVTAGRRQMSRSNLRPSPKGDLPLDDWLLPVHYFRSDVRFPDARSNRDEPLSLEASLAAIRAEKTAVNGTGDLDPVGTFIGRDALFYELEAAARLQRVILLHGPGGTGKTELAKAFGRWWRDTGGVDDPDWVFFHSFEPGVATFGLDGVINDIGLRVYGADFARLEPEERCPVVEKFLAEHRALLIWDNFETVRSMPPESTKTLIPREPSELGLPDFLSALAKTSRSAVLITSRSPEPWLPAEVRRVPVPGLTRREADEYAAYILGSYPNAQRKRVQRAFADLMEWLDGHPLSMRLILPHLGTTEPTALLDALRGFAPLPGVTETEGDRASSLSASIAYSYAHLSEPTRRLLPAASLFYGAASLDVLTAFAQVADVPDRFAGSTREQWISALEDAAAVGLLSRLGLGMYRIHPALPAYLAAQWREADTIGHVSQLESATRALCTSCAGLGEWLRQQIGSGDARLAYAVIDIQRRTLSSMLGFALSREQWKEAQTIVQPLESYWGSRGLVDEADAWIDQVRRATEDDSGKPPDLETPAGALWMFIAGIQGIRHIDRLQLKDAGRIFFQVLELLGAPNGSRDQKFNFAVVYQQLGLVSYERGQLDEARAWYRKSLAINNELGEKTGMAVAYHQLGRIAEARQELDEAEEAYRSAAGIDQEVGDRPGLASTYHQLGNIEFMRNRLDRAESLYHESLILKEEVGDRLGMGITYHSLGTIAEEQGRLVDAEEWYRQAVAIKEQFGDKLHLVLTYLQLGSLARRRGRPEQAEAWYLKSLDIYRKYKHATGLALTLYALGELAKYQGDLSRALEFWVLCVSLFEEFPHPASLSAPEDLARMSKQLGMSALEEAWQRVTDNPLPQAVRDYVECTRSGEPGLGSAQD